MFSIKKSIINYAIRFAIFLLLIFIHTGLCILFQKILFGTIYIGYWKTLLGIAIIKIVFMDLNVKLKFE